MPAGARCFYLADVVVPDTFSLDGFDLGKDCLLEFVDVVRGATEEHPDAALLSRSLVPQRVVR